MKRDASTITDISFNKFDEELSFKKGLVKYSSPVRPKSGYLEPFQISWKELSYKVLNNTKTILNNVTGTFKSGQIMAIMGPSGAGKSTLLSCVCGQQKKGVTGSITISTKRKVCFELCLFSRYLFIHRIIRLSLH